MLINKRLIKLVLNDNYSRQQNLNYYSSSVRFYMTILSKKYQRTLLRINNNNSYQVSKSCMNKYYREFFSQKKSSNNSCSLPEERNKSAVATAEIGNKLGVVFNSNNKDKEMAVINSTIFITSTSTNTTLLLMFNCTMTYCNQLRK